MKRGCARLPTKTYFLMSEKEGETRRGKTPEGVVLATEKEGASTSSCELYRVLGADCRHSG